MSAEENKAIVQRWWEGLNKGTALDLVAEVYAEDYVLHDPSQPEPVRGLDGVRAFVQALVTGFPDLHNTIEDLVADGDRVVQRVTGRGTHQGEFQGIPATGRPITVWVMVISRFAGGKIVEEWQMVDTLGMLQQLGVIPMPEAAAA